MMFGKIMCLLVAAASSLKVSGPYDFADPCPFGYGAGCGSGSGTIDPATKAQVADLLEGILQNLQSKHSLASISHSVHKAQTKTAASAGVKHAMQGLLQRLKSRGMAQNLVNALCNEGSAYFGACGGSGTLDPATKAQVANILEGILSNLQHQH